MLLFGHCTLRTFWENANLEMSLRGGPGGGDIEGKLRQICKVMLASVLLLCWKCWKKEGAAPAKISPSNWETTANTAALHTLHGTITLSHSGNSFSGILAIAIVMDVRNKNYISTRVSNGSGQCNLFGTKGQKFIHCPRTKGRWDKLKVLPWTSRDSQPNSGRDAGGDNHCFSVKIQDNGRDRAITNFSNDFLL